MNPRENYRGRSERYARQLKALQPLFRLTAPLRLLTFVAATALLLLFIKSQLNPAYLYGAAAAFSLFILGVIWDLFLVGRQKELKTRLQINKNELRCLEHDFTHLDPGSELSGLQPELAGDFDLFGPGSLFQYLNRTVTAEGRKGFAQDLVTGSRDSNHIRNRQAAIAELAALPAYLENFRTFGLLAKAETNEVERLRQWLRQAPVPTSTLHRLAQFWPLIIGAWLLGTSLGSIPGNFLFIPLLLALGLVGSKVRQSNQIHQQLTNNANTLQKYARLINLVQEQDFQSVHLKELQNVFGHDQQKADSHLEDLFKLLERFDYRNNLIVALLLNVLFLFDFRMVQALERWKKRHKDQLPLWLNSLAHLDSLNSFAIFAYNNTGKVCYPVPEDSDFVFSGQALKHPLLPYHQAVGNNLHFEGRPKVLTITGANMAGKSTFLRTLATNLLLAMNGAPVCALSLRFHPCDLRSSINIRDSLAQNESYFYAELKRLKSIVAHVEKQPNTLVVLDEILRGTNSMDKHKGSYELLEKFLSLKAVVVIATHDLGIGELARNYPGLAENHCFEVALDNDQLLFDYQLHPGISQKLNASFLMQQMGLTTKREH